MNILKVVWTILRLSKAKRTLHKDEIRRLLNIAVSLNHGAPGNTEEGGLPRH